VLVEQQIKTLKVAGELQNEGILRTNKLKTLWPNRKLGKTEVLKKKAKKKQIRRGNSENKVVLRYGQMEYTKA
jgi:hypothetical protein